MSEPSVTTDLRIFDVRVSGDVLYVALYGGPSNSCGSVSFTYTDTSELHTQRKKLEHWHRQGTPVELVQDDEAIVVRTIKENEE